MTTKKIEGMKLDTLSERIAYALEQRQMSQKGLEDEARLSRGYVSRIMKGDRVKLSPDLMRRIADALRVSFEWVATGRGEMEAPPGTISAIAPRVGQLGFALEAAIAYHQGKWSAPAVAAARALTGPDVEGLQPQEWAEVLDQIEAALAKVKIRRR